MDAVFLLLLAGFAGLCAALVRLCDAIAPGPAGGAPTSSPASAPTSAPTSAPSNAGIALNRGQR